MRLAVCIALIVAAALPAFAHQAVLSPEGCHDDTLAGSFHCHRAQPYVVAGVPAPPLSPAAIELRNPTAPQGNFIASTIADDDVFAAQVVLHKNGCYDGALDGTLGPGTIYAIKLFEAHMGLQVTGTLDETIADTLRDHHDRFDICR